jgi:hypothetical protein
MCSDDIGASQGTTDQLALSDRTIGCIDDRETTFAVIDQRDRHAIARFRRLSPFADDEIEVRTLIKNVASRPMDKVSRPRNATFMQEAVDRAARVAAAFTRCVAGSS